MFEGLEHPAIAAADSDALAQWYCDIFGFRIVYRSDAKPSAYLLKLGHGSMDGKMLEILPAESKQRQDYEQKGIGLRHLGITVKDFDQVVDYLSQKKIELFNRVDTFDGGKLIFFRDPEENLLHLIWRPRILD